MESNIPNAIIAQLPPIKKLEDMTISSTEQTYAADYVPPATSPQKSVESVGLTLPAEVTDCSLCDFSELPARHLRNEVLSTVVFEDDQRKMASDAFRMEQLVAIKNLPGKLLDERVHGPDIEDILEADDMGFWWVHVGFPVGGKGSRELQEFDLWMGEFVFEKESTEVLLWFEPVKFCKAVRKPDRAEELSDLCEKILWRALLALALALSFLYWQLQLLKLTTAASPSPPP